jgi:hypothetical protein
MTQGRLKPAFSQGDARRGRAHRVRTRENMLHRTPQTGDKFLEFRFESQLMPMHIKFQLHFGKYLRIRRRIRLMSRCKKVAVPTLVVF